MDNIWIMKNRMIRTCGVLFKDVSGYCGGVNVTECVRDSKNDTEATERCGPVEYCCRT